MKILIVGQFGEESFGLHIKEGLEIIGHEVVRCVPFYKEYRPSKRNHLMNRLDRFITSNALFASKMLRNIVMKRIIKEITTIDSDIIICTGDYFIKDEVKKIKKLTNSKIVMWYPDHLMNFGRSFFMTAEYDALFFKDPYIVKNLVNIYSKNAFYLPECFSTKRHVPVEYNKNDANEYNCDIAMIGNLHSFRVPLLELISDFNLRIYGASSPWWLNIDKIGSYHSGKYLAYEDKSRGIKYAKISLNTLYFGEIEGVNVRTFEIAGMGGFQIVQHKQGISELFEIDKEIVTYSSIDELREKLIFYLSEDNKRKEISDASRKRAWSDHTYEKRLQRLINITISRDNEISFEDRIDYKVF
jgi:spore maturation protein CgeB